MDDGDLLNLSAEDVASEFEKSRAEEIVERIWGQLPSHATVKLVAGSSTPVKIGSEQWLWYSGEEKHRLLTTGSERPFIDKWSQLEE